ncbi:MAG: rod shape-determining protein MreD [Paludibacteraceae bacterium]|nr:rod shape-determining protein MreD [Paludibacteraceae bacterium]
MRNFGEQILWFIGLVFLQVIFFNHVNLAYVVNPFIYIYFVLVFPTKQKHVVSVVLAFLLGFFVDAFSFTWGIHTIATTALGYFQPIIFRMMAKPEQLDKPYPSLSFMHGDFVKYVAIMVFFHHFLLFLIEASDFSLILWVLAKTIVSSLLTFLFVYVIEKIRK